MSNCIDSFPSVCDPNWEVVGGSLVIDGVRISFISTLRVSEDGLNALPPGFGEFPLRAVDVDDSRLPDRIRQRGGVMLPMYPHEAMWLNFSACDPAALQVGAGGRCAVTGNELTDELSRDPQNYVVLPTQPWLDGFKTADGEVRQFVAVALGSGLTVEKQLTGSESVGGLQLQVRRLTPEALQHHQTSRLEYDRFDTMVFCAVEPDSMGLGAGGRIDQEIYEDEFEVNQWETLPLSKVWVHLVSAAEWQRFTGELAPESWISVEDYVEAGLPWFDYVNPTGVDVAVTPGMAGIKSIGELSGSDESLPVVSPEDSVVRTIVGNRDGRVATGSWGWTDGRLA